MSVLVSRAVRVWVLAAITIAIASGHVSAHRHPVSRNFDAALAGLAGKGGDRTPVIVRLREGSGTSVRELLRHTTSKVKYDHDSVSALSTELRAEDFESIADLDEVESVSIDANLVWGERLDEHVISGNSLVRQ
jgi:hypothetical protein